MRDTNSSNSGVRRRIYFLNCRRGGGRCSIVGTSSVVELTVASRRRRRRRALKGETGNIFIQIKREPILIRIRGVDTNRPSFFKFILPDLYTSIGVRCHDCVKMKTLGRKSWRRYVRNVLTRIMYLHGLLKMKMVR